MLRCMTPRPSELYFTDFVVSIPEVYTIPSRGDDFTKGIFSFTYMYVLGLNYCGQHCLPAI